MAIASMPTRFLVGALAAIALPALFAAAAEPPGASTPGTVAATPGNAPSSKPAAAAAQAPAASPATAPPASIADGSSTAGQNVTAPIAAWNAALNRISVRLHEPITDQSVLESVRTELDDRRGEIEDYIAKQKPRLADLQARMKKLGEPPKAGEPPEPEAVAQQRTQLRKAIGDLSGALKAANEALVRTDSLAARARDIRRSLFETRLLKRGRSPLSPALWRDIAYDAPLGLTRAGFMLSHWWQSVEDRGLFAGLILASVLLWAVLSLVCYRRIQSLREWIAPGLPPEWRRAASAARVILLRSLPTVVACGFLYFSLSGTDLLSPSSAALVLSAIAGLIIIATVQAAAKTSLAVIRPRWRLLRLTDHAARRLYYHLLALAVIYGLDVFISAVNQIAYMPFSVSVGQSFIASVLIAGLIISMLRIRDNSGGDGPAKPIGRAYLRLPLWIIALAILGAALIGYVSLARFIAGQLIVASTIIIITYLLGIWVSAFGQSLADDNSAPGAWLQGNFGLDQHRREQVALPLTLILKTLLIIGAVPLILLLWGFDWYDILGWMRQALFGFDIGGVHISVTAIIAALLLFAAGYIAAKFFQTWLDGSILRQAGLEPGLRDSIRTGVGYLGIALAALLAVSYLGLDFSNLAIVAGALSVGVGFGLQSIVNNFVSGLILLAERPVKIGDWIIVGGQEGIVRKISVRSTEIETFDRANLIIPNSMLITDMVKNWTLHNATGRMPIPVGVHYDSDPEKVRDVLLDVAQQHPQVLSNPAPFVFFEDFASSSLNFILFVYLANVNRSFSVRTDLRIAILKAFRANGIEIPYPQTDVHLRDLDWIKKAIADRRARPVDKGPMTVRDYEAESVAPGENGDAS